MSEVGQLITEKDEMLAKIQKCEAEIVNLRHKNKVVKEEADEYRSRLMCLQNQVKNSPLFQCRRNRNLSCSFLVCKNIPQFSGYKGQKVVGNILESEFSGGLNNIIIFKQLKYLKVTYMK